MPAQTFEEVWRLLHKLEGEIVLTPDKGEPNKIGSFGPKGMTRMHLRPGTDKDNATDEDWTEGSPVPKREFENWWKRLVREGTSERNHEWRIAAACLERVPGLGVTITRKRNPLTLSLDIVSGGPLSVTDENDDMWEFSDPERIVVDPNICSGKPTIRGTRIMVSNILGMFSGGYSINRVLKAYPELSRLDVISAVEYASWVVDVEKVVART